MTITAAAQSANTREALVRRGILLSYATISYNSLEAIVSLIAGILAGSVALVGFGFDSVIEVAASLTAQWRLRSDMGAAPPEDARLWTMGIAGACLFPLARHILFDPR